MAVNEQGDAVHGPEAPASGYDHYLVKFRGADDPEDAAQIEQAYATMARAAGVRMPETRLIAGGRSQHYFAARRFDREGVKRLHAHSASGLLYADFRLPSLGYKDLIALTRAVTRDRREGRAMFDVQRPFPQSGRPCPAIHISDVARWKVETGARLRPHFRDRSRRRTHHSVLGRGKNIDRERLLALGRYADLKDREAREVIDCAAAAVADWHLFAAGCDVSTASCKRIAKALGSV